MKNQKTEEFFNKALSAVSPSRAEKAYAAWQRAVEKSSNRGMSGRAVHYLTAERADEKIRLLKIKFETLAYAEKHGAVAALKAAESLFASADHARLLRDSRPPRAKYMDASEDRKDAAISREWWEAHEALCTARRAIKKDKE